MKDTWGSYEGVYNVQETGIQTYHYSDCPVSDDTVCWEDAYGENAIWYIDSCTSNYYESIGPGWIIGKEIYCGTDIADIYSPNNGVLKMCPNNEGYVREWKYWNPNSGSGKIFNYTNDAYVKCVNEDDFCTPENPCVIDKGDCDTHDECQDDLSCGSNNCPDYLGFHSEFDCCYVPTVGDEHFCTNANPCAVNEGDCDSNNQCKTNLFCDPTSSCPAYLGFTSGVNCCSTGSQCKIHEITSKQKRFTRTL